MRNETNNAWMMKVGVILFTLHFSLLTSFNSFAQNTFQNTYNQIDESGNISQRSDNQNFNKHNNDTTRNKEIPKGLYTWTLGSR